MTMEEIRLYGVIVAAIGSLLSFFGVIYVASCNRQHTLNLQRYSQKNERLFEDIKHSNAEKLASLQSELSAQSHRSQKNYEKKLEVLSGAFDKLGKIQSLVESYVVPYTVHTQSRDPQKLVEASKVFEELREYHLRNAIFFDKDDKLGSSMSEIMGQLNYLNNISDSDGMDVVAERQKAFNQKINPAIYSVKEQYQRATAA